MNRPRVGTEVLEARWRAAAVSRQERDSGSQTAARAVATDSESASMPGTVRKQSLQRMHDFKAFAEQGQDVRDAQV